MDEAGHYTYAVEGTEDSYYRSKYHGKRTADCSTDPNTSGEKISSGYRTHTNLYETDSTKDINITAAYNLELNTGNVRGRFLITESAYRGTSIGSGIDGHIYDTTELPKAVNTSYKYYSRDLNVVRGEALITSPENNVKTVGCHPD